MAEGFPTAQFGEALRRQREKRERRHSAGDLTARAIVDNTQSLLTSRLV